jgi:glycogen operon protein
LRELDDDGRPVRDNSFLLLFNAHHEPLTFTMPAASFGKTWKVLIDTAAADDASTRSAKAAGTIEVAARAIVVASRPSISRA